MSLLGVATSAVSFGQRFLELFEEERRANGDEQGNAAARAIRRTTGEVAPETTAAAELNAAEFAAVFSDEAFEPLDPVQSLAEIMDIPQHDAATALAESGGDITSAIGALVEASDRREAVRKATEQRAAEAKTAAEPLLEEVPPGNSDATSSIDGNGLACPGSDGYFSLEHGGTTWRAMFRDSRFIPELPDNMGDTGVQVVSSGICLSRGWRQDGSIFAWESSFGYWVERPLNASNEELRLWTRIERYEVVPPGQLHEADAIDQMVIERAAEVAEAAAAAQAAADAASWFW